MNIDKNSEDMHIENNYNHADEKHHKYKSEYKKNCVYWGLGIENELYLEFTNRKIVSRDFFLKNHRRERYSVDYFSNYKLDYLKEAFNHYVMNECYDNTISLPLIINAHSFTRTDASNQPRTMYTKLCEPNPKFSGCILIDYLKTNNPYFEYSNNDKWLFDGDTVEFATNGFFNAKLGNILKELRDNKAEFISELNDTLQTLKIYREYGDVKFMEANHGFAVHLTNLNNISMFNNGTLHYNITLPTELDSDGIVKNPALFNKMHCKAIRVIQWMEPFLIGVYGTPDPFSQMSGIFFDKHKFSAASQRCAMSRYIGIGTFDTKTMTVGKILNVKKEEMELYNYEYWWHHQFYADNAYTKLDEMGMDINFNKHYNHGIELRFLDHINSEEHVRESFEFVIYLMDMVLENPNEEFSVNPIYDKIWNDFVVGMIRCGGDYCLTGEEKSIYEKLLNMRLNSFTLRDIYYEIYKYLKKKYNKICKDEKGELYMKPIGEFSSLTLDNNYNVDKNEIKMDDIEVEVVGNNCCLWFSY